MCPAPPLLPASGGGAGRCRPPRSGQDRPPRRHRDPRPPQALPRTPSGVNGGRTTLVHGAGAPCHPASCPVRGADATSPLWLTSRPNTATGPQSDGGLT
ncbi:hypothetical protein T261_5540 [Streptomyces lydicus]|nr:hypothetical protein T261_5540 [Streptomyces lydicus]